MNPRKEEKKRERRRKGKSWKMDLFYTNSVAQTLFIKMKCIYIQAQKETNITQLHGVTIPSYPLLSLPNNQGSLADHFCPTAMDSTAAQELERTYRIIQDKLAACQAQKRLIVQKVTAANKRTQDTQLTRVSLLVVENSKKNVAARITACITKPSCLCTD